MVDFTAISTKNHDIQVAQEGQRTIGTSCRHHVVGIPIGEARLKEAIDGGLEKAGPDYDVLLDGVVYNTNTNFLLYQRQCYEVEGTPVQTLAN
jgi:hypothetical protein